MWEDPIIKEIRESAQKISDDCKNNIHLFAKMLKEHTDRNKSEGFTVITKSELDKKRTSCKKKKTA